MSILYNGFRLYHFIHLMLFHYALYYRNNETAKLGGSTVSLHSPHPVQPNAHLMTFTYPAASVLCVRCCACAYAVGDKLRCSLAALCAMMVPTRDRA